MASFNFTNRTTRLQTGTLKRSMSITGPMKKFEIPRFGRQAFKYKLYGNQSIDTDRGISLDSTDAEGGLLGVDALLYNDDPFNGTSLLIMDIYVNGFFRSSVEFDADKLGQPFGYMVGVELPFPFYSNLSIAEDNALFSDYMVQGVFTEGAVDLTSEFVIFPTATPVPTEPEPTPTPTETPEDYVPMPPTPEPTEELPPTPEPTSTFVPTEPPPTPTPLG